MDPIENCEKYSGKNNCEKCIDGFILEPEGLTCNELTKTEIVTVFNEKCRTYRRINTCVVCLPGYYFDNTGSCVSCLNRN